MNNVYFGIFIGIFLAFGGQLAFRKALVFFKERKEANKKELVEIVTGIINKEE